MLYESHASAFSAEIPTGFTGKVAEQCERGPDLKMIAGILRARRARGRFFSSELFADPAWEMLLELYDCHLRQQRISVSKLCVASGVPASTALRWTGKLLNEGLVVRNGDPLDARRSWVELTPAAVDAIRKYFDEISSVLAA